MYFGKAFRHTVPLVLLVFIMGLLLPLASFIVTAEAIEQNTRNELVTELIHYLQDKYQSGEDLDAHAAYVLSLAGENPDDSNWQRNGRALKSDIEALVDLLGDNRNLVTYLLAHQNPDGSFGPYANEYTTAPALQALAVARNDIPVGDAVYAEVEEAITKAVLFLQESYRTHGYAADTFGFDHRCVKALATAGIDLDTADWRQNGSTLKESVVENAYRVADEAGSVTDAVYLAKHLNALYAVEPTDTAVGKLAEHLLALQRGDAGADGLFGTASVYAELLVLRVLGRTGHIDAVRQDDALTFINRFRYEHHNQFGQPTGAGWGGFGAPESDATAQVLSVFSAFTVYTAGYQDDALAYLGDIQHPDTGGITHPWDPAFATAETLLALHALNVEWQEGQWTKDLRTKTVSQCLLALNEWNDGNRAERLTGMLADRQRSSDPGRGSFENSVYSDMWAFLALGESGKLSVINTVYARDYLLGKQQADTGEEDGSWGETRDGVYCPNFLSTGQALRSLTYFPGHADDQDVAVVVEAGVEWLKRQRHDDGGYYHGGEDPLVDTAELILTLVRLDLDPAGPEWNRTVDGRAVGPVDYLRSHAHDPANIFAATQALHALLVVPGGSFDGTPPGSPGSGETDVALVGVAVVGKNGELLFGPAYVPLTKDSEWGPTALGALDATGLPYQTSDQWRGYVTCIAGQCAQGMDGWMFKVNGVPPSVGAADKAVRDGDRVIWWYSTDWSDPGPDWDKLLERAKAGPEEQPREEQDVSTGDLPTPLKPSVAAEDALRQLSELLGIPAEGAVLGLAAEAVRAVAVLESEGPLSWKAWRQLREELSRNPVDLSQDATVMEGVVLSDVDAGIGLAIPPEALDRDTTITIRELRGEGAVPPVPAGYRPVSAFYALGPDETTFSRPATLALRLAVPPTVRPENLFLARYDRKQGTWTVLPAVYDPARRLLVAGVKHFSTFAVLGSESRATFADVGADSFGWARDPVEFLAGAGIIRGVGDNRFEPGRPVTRAELICLLARALELEETPGSAFTDVPDGAWYAGAVNAAAGAGLARGYADGGFRPEAPITRQELASMLGRALELDDTRSGTLTFTDAEAVAEWAKNSVSAASAAGLVTGYPDGSFRPGGQATRAETAAMVYRALMIGL